MTAVTASPPKVVVLSTVRVSGTAHPLRHTYQTAQSRSASAASSTCTTVGHALRVCLLCTALLLLLASQLALYSPRPDQGYERAGSLMRGFRDSPQGGPVPHHCDDNPFLQAGDVDLVAAARAARAWHKGASLHQGASGVHGRDDAAKAHSQDGTGERCSNSTCSAVSLLPPLVHPVTGASWAWDRLGGILVLNPGAVLSTGGQGQGRDCTVYSLGLGDDVAADEDSSNETAYEHAVLQASHQCMVHTFDCRAAIPPVTQYPVRHSFHSICLQGQQRDTEGQSLLQAMTALGHAGVELMRVDIEGAEGALVAAWYKAWLADTVGTALPMQVTLEVHATPTVQAMAQQLVTMGYVLVAAEVDTAACEVGCLETVWVRALCAADARAILS